MPTPTNIRKIPKNIRAQLHRLSGKSIVAGIMLRFSADDLRRNVLAKIGVVLDDKGLRFPATLIPRAANGKYSKINREGEVIVRRDLPLETQYTSVETPNWGDSYKGTHTVDLPHEAYPRDFHPPHLVSLKTDAPVVAPGQPTYVIRFELDEILDQTAPNFESRLLSCLNILLENTGRFGVNAAGATMADYIDTLRVSWDILPPGTVEEAVTRLFRGRKPSAEEREVLAERHRVLMSLKPKNLIYGTSGLQRYFGAQLRDDLVVFENIEYGNAIYVMFQRWRELSQHSRVELLSGRLGKDFIRITHDRGWIGHLRRILADHGHT